MIYVLVWKNEYMYIIREHKQASVSDDKNK